MPTLFLEFAYLLQELDAHSLESKLLLALQVENR
jgi:hypothetical protein